MKVKPKIDKLLRVYPQKLELPKVPAENDGNTVWGWLQFLRARRKEEFEMIAERNPEIRKAVDSLYEMSGDEKVRHEYEMRQKAWRDRQSQNEGYYQEGIQKGRMEGMLEGKLEGMLEGKLEGREEALFETARKMKAMGMPVDQIKALTGLSEESISHNLIVS